MNRDNEMSLLLNPPMLHNTVIHYHPACPITQNPYILIYMYIIGRSIVSASVPARCLVDVISCVFVDSRHASARPG